MPEFDAADARRHNERHPANPAASDRAGPATPAPDLARPSAPDIRGAIPPGTRYHVECRHASSPWQIARAAPDAATGCRLHGQEA